MLGIKLNTDTKVSMAPSVDQLSRKFGFFPEDMTNRPVIMGISMVMIILLVIIVFIASAFSGGVFQLMF